MQYLNSTTASGSLERVVKKNVEWQLAQPGPFSLVMFAGAGCVEYSVNSSGKCNTTSAYILDNTVAQKAADTLVPVSQLDSRQSVEQPEGILTPSICEMDCVNQVVGLSDAASYDFVLGSESDDSCDMYTTFTAYNKGAPICKKTKPPTNALPSTMSKALKDVTVSYPLHFAISMVYRSDSTLRAVDPPQTADIALCLSPARC